MSEYFTSSKLREEYHHQSIDFVLKRDDELYHRIEKLAKIHGQSFEMMAETMVNAGLDYHIRDNLQFWEDCAQRRALQSLVEEPEEEME